MTTASAPLAEWAKHLELGEIRHEVADGVIQYPIELTEDPDAPELDDERYEVVDGVRVEYEPMANRAAMLAFEIGRLLANHGRSTATGRAVSEVLFSLSAAKEIHRRPDAAFVSFERWARDVPIPDEAWGVIPELVVEVVSPSDKGEAALSKIREYFDAGVKVVWNVYPRLRVVHVFESFDSIRVVGADGELDGGAAVPGFRLSLKSLFEELGG